MRKNRTMRVAALLLALTLITSCFVGGTFAKYTTSGSTSDTARVAKWGIEMTVTGDGAFAEEYDGTVKTSVASQNLVAPGTKNDTGMSFKISGTPEVAFKLTASMGEATEVEDVFLKGATGKYLDYTTSNDAEDKFDLSKDYYPVVFTLVHTYVDGGYSIMPVDVSSGTTNKIGDTYTATERYTVTNDTTNKKVTITGTLADINAVFALVSKNMEKVDPNYALDDTFTLTWAWDFDDSGKGTNDKADTLLGNLAVDATKFGNGLTDGTDYNLELKYNFTITVEQVD